MCRSLDVQDMNGEPVVESLDRMDILIDCNGLIGGGVNSRRKINEAINTLGFIFTPHLFH